MDYNQNFKQIGATGKANRKICFFVAKGRAM